MVDEQSLSSHFTCEVTWIAIPFRRNKVLGKIGIDATRPLAERDKYEKVDVPPEVKLEVTRMLGL